MPGKECEFTIHLRITDPTTLRRHAYRKAMEDGLTARNYAALRRAEGGIKCDLIMLLDPGFLPGCKIYDSNAEVLDTN